MSNKPDIDPYYSVRDTVQETVDRIQTNHKKFQSLLKTTDTSSSNEFKDVRKSLRGDIRTVDEQLKFLKNAVEAIEKNRGNYSYIKDGELANRKKFVEQSTNNVQNVKDSIESPEVRKKIEEDKARSSHNPLQRGAIELDEGNRRKEEKLQSENERFIQGEQKKTKELLQDQDRDLDKLNAGLDTIHSQARLINDEVKTQNKMIDELDKDVNTATDKMNVVQAALAKLLKSKDSCTFWVIIILGLILILLVALVIWS